MAIFNKTILNTAKLGEINYPYKFSHNQHFLVACTFSKDFLSLLSK